MDVKTLIKERHSVRQFKDMPIDDEQREVLDKLAEECNAESGLNIQVIYDDPECFKTLLAHYGKFRNANNYIALVGNEDIDDLGERCGYFGQKMVLKAQEIGLNTCWVGGSYSKGKCKVNKEDGEKIVCVIAFGYGETQGVKHKSKPVEKLCNVAEEDMPKWFKNGMIAAMMAPTALNQQKFYVTLEGEEVTITAKRGPYTKVDLGIVKYNFEAVSGHKVL
ncbi:MAG: nitroreductase family protein [Eubacterium sp.]|nr:nitroreductase family protein [Eubacterium sp.]